MPSSLQLANEVSRGILIIWNLYHLNIQVLLCQSQALHADVQFGNNVLGDFDDLYN